MNREHPTEKEFLLRFTLETQQDFAKLLILIRYLKDIKVDLTSFDKICSSILQHDSIQEKTANELYRIHSELKFAK